MPYVTTIVLLKDKKEGKILLCTVLPLIPKGHSFLKFSDLTRLSFLQEQQVDEAEYGTLVVRHLITPWSKVLLEKVTGFRLVKKFTAFY